MKRLAEFSIVAVLSIMVGTVLRLHHVQAQNINGVPNQVMDGFTSVALTGISIGGGTTLTYEGVLSSASTTPGAIGASGCADTNFTFTGVAANGQLSMIQPPSAQTTNIMLSGARVTGTNTVSVRFCNEDILTTRTPVAGVYKAFFAW